MKVDTREMVPLGTDKHKGTINFNTTYDRDAQLQSLHEGNRKQAELTPEELDLQVLQIDEQKKNEALEQQSNLPAVPVRKSKQKTKKKKILVIGSRFKHNDGKIYTIINIYTKKVAARAGKLEYDFNKPYVKKHLL